MEFVIYFIKENKFAIANKNNIIDYFYEQLAKIWFTPKEIKTFSKQNKISLYKLIENKKNVLSSNLEFENTNKLLDKNYFTNLDKLKKQISKLNNKIPLYDVYSGNIYLIFKENVYARIIYDYYRFPDKNFADKNKEKNFLKNFDLEVLENTYVNIFYYYSNEIGKNITMCVRPSFLSHLTYISPYYTRSEIINMALNIGIIKPDKTYHDRQKVLKLCEQVKKNDINKDIILDHQKYIVNANGIHRVIYYSLNGAYFMNDYLRDKTLSKNKLMEKNIDGLHELIRNCPAFDKSYQLYRFVDSDKHLRHLKIGDIHTEKSFISTTRNPFYSTDTSKFGFILVKIKIPPNKKGVALCMETFSNFKNEQEIIFPPQTNLKLIKKNENTNYFNTDSIFEKNIVTRYEFEYVDDAHDNKSNKIKQISRKIIKEVYLDIEKIKQLKHENFLDKTQSFVKKYANKNYQFTSKINSNLYTFTCEWNDSTSVYEPYFFIKNENGFCIYCQNPKTSNLSLTMEFSNTEMHVNYYSRYSYSDNYIDITTFDAIKFISKLAYSFGINKIYIHQEYASCQDFIEDITHNTNKDLKKRILEMYTYRKDYYNYFTKKTKRFEKIEHIVPKFYYYQLDELYNMSPLIILRKNDKDELYQIYTKYMKSINTFADFYVYIIKNRPDYIKILESKIIRIFKKDNPFIIDFYLLEGFKFLYNNNIISTIPDINTHKINERVEKIMLNKSTYRLEKLVSDRIILR